MSINPADLIDANEVAEILGLSSPKTVSTYRARPNMAFPDPIVVKGSGKCVLWLRQDIEAWQRQRG